jgi:hypothetical protein
MDTSNIVPMPPHPPPALWNPNAAARWSLLFSPAFGAFLHARNADALGRPDEAKAHWIWFWVSLGFLVLAMMSTLIPVIPDMLFEIGGLILLFGWYGSLGRKQIRFVKETWQDRYQRKSWTTPLLIGGAGFVGFMLLNFILESLALSLLHLT